ncbi:hypothetical protein [Streptomyces sp. BA2]|uniref:hypothetical protein n=1 Tax=Streptomyces sp. BA2 TaxID=436595 RepID=UPI0013269F3B|nr:hypothetical protein [Streptomyces sp. BA2]MWA11459.1 hypothetical protein [Streptomyces sp. BA2]
MSIRRFKHGRTAKRAARGVRTAVVGLALSAAVLASGAPAQATATGAGQPVRTAAVAAEQPAPAAELGAQPRAARGGQYGYHYEYFISRRTATAQVSFRKMNRIMNAVFPIPGMPKTVKKGQKICLKGGGRCNPVRVTKVGKTYFRLKSLPGHLEGANKLITFTLKKKSGGRLYLDVRAKGPKTAWQRHPLGGGANKLFAKGMWGMYATNLSSAAQYNLI